jgi:hypothetical protein
VFDEIGSINDTFKGVPPGTLIAAAGAGDALSVGAVAAGDCVGAATGV